MDEIQHYHNTIYMYWLCDALQEFVIYYFTLPNARLFTLSNTRRFTHQGESSATQWVKKTFKQNVGRSCKIVYWCLVWYWHSFIWNDRAGELLVVQSSPHPSFLVLHVFSSLPWFYHKCWYPMDIMLSVLQFFDNLCMVFMIFSV
jgi:hypothetical protein